MRQVVLLVIIKQITQLRRLLSSEATWEHRLCILSAIVHSSWWTLVEIFKRLLERQSWMHLLAINVQVWLRTKDITRSILEIWAKRLNFSIVTAVGLVLVVKETGLQVVNRRSWELMSELSLLIVQYTHALRSLELASLFKSLLVALYRLDLSDTLAPLELLELYLLLASFLGAWSCTCAMFLDLIFVGILNLVPTYCAWILQYAILKVTHIIIKVCYGSTEVWRVPKLETTEHILTHQGILELEIIETRCRSVLRIAWRKVTLEIKLTHFRCKSRTHYRKWLVVISLFQLSLFIDLIDRLDATTSKADHRAVLNLIIIYRLFIDLGLRLLRFRLQVHAWHTGHSCLLDGLQGQGIKDGVLLMGSRLGLLSLLLLAPEYLLNELALLLLLSDLLHHLVREARAWATRPFRNFWSFGSSGVLRMDGVGIWIRVWGVGLIIAHNDVLFFILVKSIAIILPIKLSAMLSHLTMVLIWKHGVRFVHRYWFSALEQTFLFLSRRIMCSEKISWCTMFQRTLHDFVIWIWTIGPLNRKLSSHRLLEYVIILYFIRIIYSIE